MPYAPCPICQKTSTLSGDNPYRPFCSLHCQNRDLGAWAAEQYSVPSTEINLPPDHENLYTEDNKE